MKTLNAKQGFRLHFSIEQGALKLRKEQLNKYIKKKRSNFFAGYK